MKALLIASLLVTAPAVAIAGHAVVGGGQPTALATGSGHAMVAGALRTFSFNAKSRGADASGVAEIDNRAQDRRLHLKLDCLRVSGTKAYASGTVVSGNHPEDIGSYWAFAVDDRGEGKDADDQITLAYLLGPALPCSEPSTQATLDAAFFPIEHGNIQVH